MCPGGIYRRRTPGYNGGWVRKMQDTTSDFLRATRPEEKLRLALMCFCEGAEPAPEVVRYLRLRSLAAMQALARSGRYRDLARFLPLTQAADRLRLIREARELSPEARAILTGAQAAAPPDGAEPRVQLIRLWLERMHQRYPALHRALSLFEFAPAQMELPLGTDGAKIYYDPGRFTRQYARNCGYSDCVHTVLHCLFFHLDAPPSEGLRGAADYVAACLQARLFPETDCPRPSPELTRLDEALRRGVQAPARDDHRFWHPCAGSDRAALWRQAAQALGAGGAGAPGPRFGLSPGSRQDIQERRRQARYDFSGYLRRFTEIREELKLDPDSIDRIPYLYGLQHYGNLPLVEPLEYQEIARVRDMVIAIDTSGSCTEAMVQQFLAETRRILTEQANFFQRMNVLIVQCDSMIQDARWIHSAREWQAYEANLRILGRGGTNFTPVFDLVEKFRRQGRLRNLRGLIYFTDGDGVYPGNRPPYEVAFASSDARILSFNAPPWCRRLCMNRKEADA